MKITRPDVIKSGEKELIDIITGELDWQQIEVILERKYGVRLRDGRATYRRGDMVVHDDQVAYQLEFETTVTLSVMFDRQGECLDVVSPAFEETAAPNSGRDPSGVADTGSTGREPASVSETGRNSLAADLAGMIFEINEE